MRLRPLRAGDESAALAGHEEMKADGFPFLLGYEPAMAWSDYVAMLDAQRCGERLPEGWVPATFLVAATESDGQIVGRSSIRHGLDEFLAREGGHIGFGVLRHHRRRGYATEILRQSLVIARAVGIDRVLVTCYDDNAASASVIERCGGVLDSIVETAAGGIPTRRYFID